MADPKPGQDESASAKATQLPIGQVVLFSSGVGYFQHQGSVQGDASAELRFKTKQINDIEDLVQKGIDILLVNPTDSVGIESAVRSANKAGVVVVAVRTVYPWAMTLSASISSGSMSSVR